MSVTPAHLSLGGFALSAAVLAFTTIRWWRTGRQAPSAAALTGGLLIGLLSALCSGGLLGWAARRTVTTITNPLGNAVAGFPGASRLLPEATPTGMSPGGAVATVVLLAVLVLVWRCCDNQLRRQIAAGALVGSAAGLTAAAAGLAARTLIPAVNRVGDLLIAAVPFQ